MGKLRTEFTSLIAKSTSPGLSNITFFACWQLAQINILRSAWHLSYKHQWNTRWAFAQKHDIFTGENNLLFFHLRKDHYFYGYIINSTFCSKKMFKWNGLAFHWCLYNKENITWPLGDKKFLFSCWKIFHEWAHSKRNLVYPCGHVISSICPTSHKWIPSIIKKLR